MLSAVVAVWVPSETGDVANTSASTAGAIDDIQELQLNVASSVEEQAVVLAEVIIQLSATAAADQVLAGLGTLIAMAER